METTNASSLLRELRGSGYEIVDGQPDIIGWSLKDNEFHKLGVVEDLLFDPQLQKVRYIIANLKDNDFELERRKVLIPIGIAEIHEQNDDVIIPTVSPWQIRALPTYNKKRFTDVDEQDIVAVFSTSTGTNSGSRLNQPKAANFYEHNYFNHDNLYRKRKPNLQNNQPVQRSFRIRQGQEENTANQHSNDRSGTTEHRNIRQQEEALASTDRNINTNNSNRHEDDNERLINRIKRMQSELNEIERDLRNSNRDVS